MEKLLYLLPVLSCVAMMGVMVWMMRGRPSSSPSDAGGREEIAALRTELAALRDQRADATGPAAGQPRSR